MSTAALRVSLRLWRWRLHRHEAKLNAAIKHDQAQRLKSLVKTDKAKIKRREHQLAQRAKPAQHQDWLPGARRLERTGTPWQVACPSKGVLHTTEGSGDATGTLDANGDHPHFQVEQNGRITQYLPMGVGAKALKHTSDPPTNGAHAYQIEVCGFASRPDWPVAQKAAVRKVMRFIEANGGVARESHVSFTKPARLTGSQWLALRGWCGHVHVPENDHVDPGAIQIGELL